MTATISGAARCLMPVIEFDPYGAEGQGPRIYALLEGFG